MALSKMFMNELLEGHLTGLLAFLQMDRTLCPEIRDDTLSVYYRGGRLLKLELSRGEYVASFDSNYCKFSTEPWSQNWVSRIERLPGLLNNNDDVVCWIDLVPSCKAVMDNWISSKGNQEREAQQLIVRENNLEGDYARATDYFFCDMERVEYFDKDNKRKGLRLDLIGVHWPSNGAERRVVSNRELVVSEVKYGDSALKGEAGVVSHFEDLQLFLKNEQRVHSFKEAMKSAFNQKHLLGLVQCKNELESLSESNSIRWLLWFINHDPEKVVLKQELEALQKLAKKMPKDLITIQIAFGCPSGYGLFEQSVFSLDEFLEHDRIWP